MRRLVCVYACTDCYVYTKAVDVKYIAFFLPLISVVLPYHSPWPKVQPGKRRRNMCMILYHEIRQ